MRPFSLWTPTLFYYLDLVDVHDLGRRCPCSFWKALVFDGFRCLLLLLACHEVHFHFAHLLGVQCKFIFLCF